MSTGDGLSTVYASVSHSSQVPMSEFCAFTLRPDLLVTPYAAVLSPTSLSPSLALRKPPHQQCNQPLLPACMHTLSLSQVCTHTHSHSCAFTYSVTHPLTPTPSHTVPFSQTHSCTHMPSHSLSHSVPQSYPFVYLLTHSHLSLTCLHLHSFTNSSCDSIAPSFIHFPLILI